MDGKMTVNDKQYEILKLLGKGKGGYSYLAGDGSRKYVLKQIHHEPCGYYQFGNKIQAELRDYEKLRKIGIKMPVIIEADTEKERILKEFIQGEELYYIDYECNDYMEEWNFENWGVKYWSKTPEFLQYVQEHE